MAAHSARRIAYLRRTCVFDAVQQKEVLLWTVAGHREHIAEFRVRGTSGAGALRRVIHRARIKREQLVVAAPVERKILHLPLSDKPGSVFRHCRKDIGIGGHLHGLVNLTDLQRKVDLLVVADNERDSGSSLRAKARLVRDDFVIADR